MPDMRRILASMSINESTNGAVPQLTIGWRIQMALDHAGVSTEEIAQHLDVSRSTISRWCNDHGAAPKRLYVDAIAHRCDIDPDWLKTGRTTPQERPDGTPDQGGRRSGWIHDLAPVTPLRMELRPTG